MDREISFSSLAALILVTLLLRIACVSYDWQSFGRDPDDYGRLAQNLVKTGTYGYPAADPLLARVQPEAARDIANRDPLNGAVSDGRLSSPLDGPLISRLDAPLVMRATAYRPPLYPGLLCAAFWEGELNKQMVAGIHVLLGLLTVLSVYYVAWRMAFRWPWLPALAVACDPILLYQSRELMTETLVTFLTVWAWALYLILLRPSLAELGQVVLGMRLWLRASLLLGLALGLACLTRPTMLPWALAAIAVLSLRSTPAGNRVSIISAALLVLATMHVGWMMRNKHELGQPIFTTTHGGYTLLLANNPVLYRHFQNVGPSRAWNEDEFHQLWNQRRQKDSTQWAFWNEGQTLSDSESVAISELADDRLAQQVALMTIKSRPELFALSCLYRAGWFWALFPLNAGLGVQWALGLWYGLWFLMALIGLLRMWEVKKSRIWLMPLLLVVSLTLIHCIYWSNMRMRAPVMPVVYVLACWPLMRVRTLSRLPS